MRNFIECLKAAVQNDHARGSGMSLVKREDLENLLRDHARIDAAHRANHGLFQLATAGMHWGLAAGIAERLTHAQRGYTPVHDDKQTTGGLAGAAVFYAMHPHDRSMSIEKRRGAEAYSPLYPFNCGWFDCAKFVDIYSSKADRKKELAVAISLLAAEWDRLDRIERAETAKAEVS